MSHVAQWSMAITMAVVGLSVHLCARVWNERQLFFVELGRELTDEDRALSRRVVLLNLLITVIGVGLSFAGDSLVALVTVSVVLPLLAVGLLLYGVVSASRAAEPQPVPQRFVVPLDDPPSLSDYVVWPLEIAHVAMLGFSCAWFASMLDKLPHSVPMQWNTAGQVARQGPPEELWMMPGLMVFDLALMWLIMWSIARERWVLPVDQPDRYATLQVERRTLIVRMLEVMIFGINLSMVVVWLGLAFSYLPGNERWQMRSVVACLLVMTASIVIPMVLYMGRLSELKRELSEIGGSDVLGTHADGWRWGGIIYYAPEDPALFVPKKVGIGQTLNMARPGAWVLLVGITVVPLLIAVGALLFAR